MCFSVRNPRNRGFFHMLRQREGGVITRSAVQDRPDIKSNAALVAASRLLSAQAMYKSEARRGLARREDSS